MPTDENLALGVQQGRRDDLAALVERHQGQLVGFLYRMTGGDRTLAEDLTQEAFLRVLRAIEQYRYPRPFKPWLYAIAVNLARDHFKRADTRRSAVGVPDAPSDGMPLDAALLADDEARRVVVAIAALPTHQREAVLLRYYQELSLAEIAEALNVPVGTVKSRLTLGLRRLKERLEEEDERVPQRP